MDIKRIFWKTLLMLVFTGMFVTVSESMWEVGGTSYDIDAAVRQMENSDEAGAINRAWWHFDSSVVALMLSGVLAVLVFRPEINYALNSFKQEGSADEDK